MTDRPILFSAPMVRAILEGRKTQARSVFSRFQHPSNDRLWVRETWQWAPPPGVIYRADAEVVGTRWRSPMSMPRWASRLTLIVKAVKVERLRDISEADAMAEGVAFIGSAKEAFQELWDTINGKKHPWASNPWVAAITFEPHLRNIDKITWEDLA